jgi:hypothetical protein
MVREQMIQFLQAAVVFLLLTNAVSAITAILAISLVSRASERPTLARLAPDSATENRLSSRLRRAGLG